jgi:macrolide-specific efflux system membrane fusion protein
MRASRRPSGIVYALGAMCTGAIVAAFLVVGPKSESAPLQSRIVTVRRGVVQSTVSGSGNIQSATQLNLGFKTAGVVQRIYVHTGEHVTAGALVAELDPQSAEVTLEQSRATLQASEATLAQLEEDGGETSASQGSSTHASATSSASEAPKQSAATREANLASARAAVNSDRLTVRDDEQAVQDTKLYAPSAGTIVSLSGEVGEAVSGGGTTKASQTASSSSSGASTAASGGSRSSASASSSSTSSGTGSTGSSFAVLSDLSTLELVAPLSESEVTHVHPGQPATVTIEALEGAKVAAHVTEVASTATSNSGVVSYDVTFALDQSQEGVKPGMSASAEVVVSQAEGVNVPTRAISGGTVTVVHGDRRTQRRVVTGLAGDSSTIVLRGLRQGEQVALPLATSTSATNVLSRLAGRGGGLGGALGGGLGGGGGGGAFRAPAAIGGGGG